MRVVFFGSPASAIPTLAALLNSEAEIPLVVAQPGAGGDEESSVSLVPLLRLLLRVGLR